MNERATEHNLQVIMRKCRHFNGVQNKVCEAGVNYDDVQPIPCIGRIGAEVEPAICEKKSCPSREEAIEIDKERAEHTKRFMTALAAAHDDAKKKGYKKGHGGKDSLPCPICKIGTLYYSVASYNGHLWGQCRQWNVYAARWPRRRARIYARYADRSDLSWISRWTWTS